MKLTIELPQWIVTNIHNTEGNQDGRMEMYKDLIESFLEAVHKWEGGADFMDLLEYYEEVFDEQYGEMED